MTNEKFEDIKNKAWILYRNNMLEWAIRTLKNISNAPEWVRGVFAGIRLDASLSNDDFLEQYEDEIETLLVAFQEQNFNVNYTKRLVEFFEAKQGKDNRGMIEAICNMIIVAINAGFLFSNRDRVSNYTHQNLVYPLLYEYVGINPLVLEIEEKGYSPYLCLLETIKELESYTGAWNEREGKWIKDLGAYTLEEAQRKIYEMDNGVREVMWAVLEEENETHFVFEVDFGVSIQKVKVKKWYKANYEKCRISKK